MSHSTGSMYLHRFEFFLNWDPKSRGSRDILQWGPPIHVALTPEKRKDKEDNFDLILKAGMKHFPERLGFLFCKVGGITACEKNI